MAKAFSQLGRFTLRLGTTENFGAHMHFSTLIVSESSMGLPGRHRRPDMTFIDIMCGVLYCGTFLDAIA